MNETKKLGLGSVVSVSVGLVIATSCLVSLGQGAGTIGVTFIIAMVVALALNLTTIASLSELNALMPNTTGGLAQYTMAGLGPFPTLISMVGGYLICNVLSCGVLTSLFCGLSRLYMPDSWLTLVLFGGFCALFGAPLHLLIVCSRDQLGALKALVRRAPKYKEENK